MKESHVAVLAFLVFLAVAGSSLSRSELSAGGEVVDNTFHERFAVAPGATLRLEHGDGDVRITPWDQDAIEIDVVYRGDFTTIGWGSRGGFDVEMRQDGDVVRVIGRERRRGGVGLFISDSSEYRYTISAPPWMVLDLEGDDGDVEIGDWTGAIALRIDDGDVALSEVRGARTSIRAQDGTIDVRGQAGELLIEADDGDVTVIDCAVTRGLIEVEDGDVFLDRCGGDFEVSADDGDLELGLTRAGRLLLETSDGDIELAVAEPSAIDLTVISDDGDVEVALAAGTSAAFSIATSGGGIRLHAPEASDLREQEHRADGALGAGAGTIRITTSDGSVTLRAE